ncbi:MAG: peptidoglycan DD-metalloendopeptidase family protein [Rickettsiaceae bacterium]|nr:peptidoglycan DD-metalloendopeptidase family protein [Rickettsiaceae bacterium]
MELTESYLVLGAKSDTDVSYSRKISYLLFLLLACFMFLTLLSVNKFISGTLSINIVQPEESIEGDSQVNVSEITVRNGDTLSKILTRENISPEDSRKIVFAVEKSKIQYTPKIGQKITFNYDTNIVESTDEDLSSEVRTLSSIEIRIDNVRRIEITKSDSNFIARDFITPLKKIIKKTSAVISGSFMSTAKSLGLSTNNILELINAYSHQVDFQRQIKSGDKVTFITEQFFTEDGKFSHSGNVLFASMNLSGTDYNIYRYSMGDSESAQYFSEDGRSVKRNLLKTPMNVARISSHFGNRKHPIQGYTKMHRGVDFSAPIGTPIYSAGDGVITEIGWKAGYGKFIQVKHSSTLSTAYAHASRFANGVKQGSRIKQGQVIAYVGTTGNSTGPHLHYEVRINGKQVNPMSVKGTPGMQLTGAHKTKFENFKKEVLDIGKEV